jgi:phage terminase large subunit-like protein
MSRKTTKPTRPTSSSSKRNRAANEPLDPATAYAVAVLRGDEVAGPHVRAACSRHMKDLEHGHARGLKFDTEAADRVYRYFRTVLRLSEGQFEGIPFELHPSQAFIVGSLFGWKWPDGTRRFRRAYVEQGKGNGKSPLAAGIGLYGMSADDEPGAEIYAAAARKEQAQVLYRDAVKMAQKSRALASKIKFSGQSPVWNMAMLGKPQSGSFFRCVSREAGRSGSGPRPHFALCDEVHEHPDRHVMELLERGFKFRRQPLLLMTTNSGTDRKSVCWEEHEHAVRVAHGDAEDDTTFAYVCSLDEKDDPLNDPSCWRKANPLLGSILTEDYLQGVVNQARAMPGKLNGVLRLHFCCWTDAETAWIGREAWEACEDPNLELEDFAGKRVFAGLDLGSTKDLSAKALVFDDGKTDDGKPRFAAFVHGYTPKDTLIERARLDKAPYDVWAKQGHLTATPGSVVRYDHIADDLVDDANNYDLQAVAYDRHLIKHFEEAVNETGSTLPLIEHGQGLGQRKGCPPDCKERHKHEPAPLWMPQSVTELETLILEGRIRFAVNPALRSAVASARFWQSPAGLRRFEKNKPGGRIDMCIALTMAVGAATGSVQVKPLKPQLFFLGSR